MRAFRVPIQINEEEKIIGGYISLRQFMYLLTGFSVGGLSFAISFLPVIIRFILFCVIFTLGIVLGFLQIKEMRADQYLYDWFNWKIQPKRVFNRRGNS